MVVWIVLIVVSAVLFPVTFIYNRLVRLRNSTENAWAAIDVRTTQYSPSSNDSGWSGDFGGGFDGGGGGGGGGGGSW